MPLAAYLELQNLTTLAASPEFQSLTSLLEYPELRNFRPSSLQRDDIMDAACFNEMYQTDFRTAASNRGLSWNERNELVERIRRYTGEATGRHLEESFFQAVEQRRDRSTEGVEHRMRVAVMEPLRLDDVSYTADQEIPASRFRPCPISFQVVFNGRDIVRVVD